MSSILSHFTGRKGPIKMPVWKHSAKYYIKMKDTIILKKEGEFSSFRKGRINNNHIWEAMGTVAIFSKPKPGYIFWLMIWHMVWPHDRIFEIKMSWKTQDMWLPWQWGAIGRLWAMKRQGRIGKHGKLFCQWGTGQLEINRFGRLKRQEERNFTNLSVRSK